MLFSDARRKVERADKHIADIQTMITALPDAYVATIEVNPGGGNQVIKHDLSGRTERLEQLGLVIGDAVHNLKCALDYAWLGAIERLAPQAVSDFAKFPVRHSLNELVNALHGRKIDVSSPALFRLITCQIQPYDGGNDDICVIHHLDIRDKHRLLTPVVTFAAIEGIELENERGEIERGGTWPTTEQPPYYVPIEGGWHIKNKGHVTVEVLFEDGTALYEFEVLDTLSRYSRVTLNVIQLLENV